MGLNSNKELQGADIFTFWDDIEWKHELQNLGAIRIFILPPRPTGILILLESMFEKMNYTFFISIFSDAWIGIDWIKIQICGFTPVVVENIKICRFPFTKT